MRDQVQIENYWGTDFSSANDSPPVALLKAQAELLTRTMNGRLTGVVRESAEGGTVYTSLYVYVPSMDYQYMVLRISHPVDVAPSNPFPITVFDSFHTGDQRKIENMPEFEQYLKQLLSSEPVHNVIGNLIKYS